LCIQTAVHSWSPNLGPSTTGVTFLLSRTQEQRNLQLYLFFGNNDNDGDQQEQPQPQPRKDDFFIRKSLKADVGRASKILADGFFKGKTNIFTYQVERLETYLSLESGFPKPNTLHEIYVACNALDGIVLGMAEVDARMGLNGRGQNGPYMCNVAVEESCHRRGIASALVAECEAQVLEWYLQPRVVGISGSLYLKVRQSNIAAVQMYDKLGYHSIRQDTEERSGETVLVMSKELPFASSATSTNTTSTTTNATLSES
jgi:ribosomal protein S18 acetylase RimI-like enzyme